MENNGNVSPKFYRWGVGRIVVGGVDLGVVGEVSLQVLEAWKLENPVAAFEIDLQKIFDKSANTA